MSMSISPPQNTHKMMGAKDLSEGGQGHDTKPAIGFNQNPLLESLMKLSKISSPFEGIIPDVGGNDTR